MTVEDSHWGNNSAILFNFWSCTTSNGINATLIATVDDAITIHLHTISNHKTIRKSQSRKQKPKETKNTHQGKPVRSWKWSSTDMRPWTGSSDPSPAAALAVAPKSKTSSSFPEPATPDSPNRSKPESCEEPVEKNRDEARGWWLKAEAFHGRRLELEVGIGIGLGFERRWNWREWERAGRKVKAEEERRRRRRWDESLEEVAICGGWGV